MPGNPIAPGNNPNHQTSGRTREVSAPTGAGSFFGWGRHMRARVRDLVVGILAGAVTMTATPAVAVAATQTVPLIVGLRQEAAPVAALHRIDATRTADLSEAVAVDVPAGEAAAATRTLLADPNVAYVEPDHVATVAAVRPDDPGYPAQWGVTMARVNEAWSATRGAARVTIAVRRHRREPPARPRRPAAARPRLRQRRRRRDRRQRPRHDGGRRDRRGRQQPHRRRRHLLELPILPVKVLDARTAAAATPTSPRASATPPTGAPPSSACRWAATTTASCCATRWPTRSARARWSSRRPAIRARRSRTIPAAIPSVLAVGGVTSTGARYPWSNYGSWVDVAAPGCNRAQDRTGALSDYCGTSSATPFVAGVAGLVAVHRAAAVRRGDPVGAGRRRGAPAGRVDALGALGRCPSPGTPRAPAVAFGTTPASGSGPGHGHRRGRGPARGRAGSAVRRGQAGRHRHASRRTRSAGSPRRAPVPLPLELRAYDRAGNVAVLRRYVRADNTPPAVQVCPARPPGHRASHRRLGHRPAGAAGQRPGGRPVTPGISGSSRCRPTARTVVGPRRTTRPATRGWWRPAELGGAAGKLAG